MSPSSSSSMLRCVLGALLVVTAIAQETADAQQQQQPSIVEVEAYKLTHVPGCEVAEGDSYDLPAGLVDNCIIKMPQMQQEDPQVFAFNVADNIEMSATFTLTVQGGAASMSIWYPDSPVNGPPDLIQTELFSSAASSEGWISIDPETIATRPGSYLLSVTAFSGAPDVVLTVYTPPSSLQLVPEERELLAGVAGQCCNGDEKVEESPFCTAIAQQSLAAEHAWFTDMCHLAPRSCDAEGHLTRLAVPGLGLNCGDFPKQLGGLTALTRLDLSGNSLSSATLQDVAEVVSSLPALEELALGSTGLSGKLTCDIITPSLKILDIAYNLLEGPLPSCLLNNLTELYIPGNAITGPLPVPTSSSPMVTLFANIQRGGGLTGSIPVAFGSLRRLKYLNLGGNSLSGALPGMPRGIKLLNISDNNLSGRLGSISAGMWNLDISNNNFGGGLPELTGLPGLEVLVANSNPLKGQIPEMPEGLQHLEASGCGLSGPLPTLPASLKRFDVADNDITGSLTGLDLTNMEVFRASNNSLSGGVPPSAAASPGLFLLDLGGNRLSGSLIDDWTAPRMQMIMLEDNAITGTIPASLGALPRLGVLRLANNNLGGTLEAFAAQIPDPKAAAATNTSFSNLFDLNVSSNHLSGPVPDSLAWLGVFNNITIIVPGAGGGPAIAPRILDLSGNKFTGDWPTWLLDSVPATASTCSCSVTISVNGPNMRLTCPPSDISVTDYAWQLAAEQLYTCWDSKESHAVQLLDQLSSTANSNDKIDTTSMARGDGGGSFWAIRGGSKPDPKVVAAAVVGIIAGLTLFAVLGYFVVYKRVVKPKVQGTGFSKFEDDPVAAAAAGGAAGDGGSVGTTGLPTAASTADVDAGSRPV